MGMTVKERAENAKLRKERILTYIQQDPPVPFNNIMSMEGISERILRAIISELQNEHGIKYIDTPKSKSGDYMPFGLTEATARFRSMLARELYRVNGPDNPFGFKDRLEAAPAVGLNPREQIRAESKPFIHDWTLSQIERLARQLGEDPREFMLKCLTT